MMPLCREGEHQREREEQPGGEELGDDRLPGGDRHGEQQLDGAGAALFRPYAHADRGHQHQVDPRVPAEERRQAGLAALEEVARGEGEEAGEQQENDQEHVRHRRGEVRAEFTLRYRPERFHLALISPYRAA
jgi:hypothetical protein